VVTVLTEVDTEVLVLVLVDGVSVVVVTGASVVVGVVVGGCDVTVGDWVTVWVMPGCGATDADVTAVVEVVGDVVVVVAGPEALLPVNFTIA
jgi:hypothetical protein